MSAINRRSLVGGFLCGAVAGLALTPGVVNAMPFDERVADNPDNSIEKARKSSSRVRVVRVRVDAGGFAGGVEVGVRAAGSGCEHAPC